MTENKAEDQKDKITIVGLFVVVFFLLVALGLLLVKEQEPRRLPVLYSLPGFSFQDTYGKIVGLEQMRGKVWIADFIFLRCSGPCPLLTKSLGDIQTKWKDKGINFVSFAIDPHDTAKELAQYAKNAGADPACWFFLLGPNKTVINLAMKGFKIPAQGDPGFQFIHSPLLSLVDSEGRIRGYYDGTDQGALQNLNNDLAVLLAEKS